VWPRPIPAVLVVYGNATVGGTIDASASGTTAYAGGNYSCDGSAAADPSCGSSADETGGGGGGGFGTAGGYCGDGDDCAGTAGGTTRGTPLLIPLLGGCPGGQGGRCTTGRGAGGGAIQLSIGGTLTLSGTLRANGGAVPNGCDTCLGGSGGGSGGAIRVEALTINTAGSTIQVNGGDGGDSYYDGGTGSTSSGATGGNAEHYQENGSEPDMFGGGGGGYGRIVLCNRTTNAGCT
jgi:hypothetical protein